MVTFPDRKAAAEKAFAIQEERSFIERVRRIRKLSEWAAHQLGLELKEATEYSNSVVQMTSVLSDDDDIIRKIEADLVRAGVTIVDAGIRSLLRELSDQGDTKAPGPDPDAS